MTVAEIFWPALLFVEDIDEFSWTGIIVPGGIVPPPSAAIGRTAAVRANARTKVLRRFHVRDCICGGSLHMGTIQKGIVTPSPPLFKIRRARGEENQESRNYKSERIKEEAASRWSRGETRCVSPTLKVN